MKNNQTQNPFTMFGTPSKVVVNGVQQPTDCIADCLTALQNNLSKIKSYTTSIIDGVIKLYVVTV